MPTSRPAFTLVEVLVAVVLIDVGLLALVAGSAVLIRQTTEMRARGAAVRVAANRLQLLGATACVASTGSTRGPFGIHEYWSVDPPTEGVREMRDSVTYASPAGERSIVLATRLPC
ncbi:MAG TPA: hypothetical protein VIP11_02935 [Gemmatimonadaceae bacterium]